MTGRYDQVEPHVGIVRAPLAANLTFDGNGEFGPKAFSIDANGRGVLGTAGQSGYAGVLIKNVGMIPAGRFTAGQIINNWMGGRAGDIVDIMIQGQMLETGLPAGSAIYAQADGDLTNVPAEGDIYVGYTVEAGRLVVVSGGHPYVEPV